MALVRAGGYGHKIVYVRPDEYVISWRYDTKAGRIRFQRGQSRDTNRRGAERFSKRWNVPMPEGTLLTYAKIQELQKSKDIRTAILATILLRGDCCEIEVRREGFSDLTESDYAWLRNEVGCEHYHHDDREFVSIDNTRKARKLLEARL